MNKRKLHHLYTRLKWLKPWYFLVIAIISTAVCIMALRANNQNMIDLRDKVYTADRQGSDVQKALGELQAYVTRHMNTNLSSGNSVYPPIQLKYTYERLLAQRGAAAAEANRRIYNQAQAECERQNPTDVSGGSRIPCIQQYVQTHTTAAAAPVPDALYKFAFVSPRWSPDLAGWSMLAAAVSSLLFAFSLAAKHWLRHVTG